MKAVRTKDRGRGVVGRLRSPAVLLAVGGALVLSGLAGGPGMAPPARAAGPTPVSGEITGHAVWSVSGSPYVVTGDVVVRPGASLTIEPGVVVEFQRVDQPKPFTRRAVIRVQGRLEAVGTDTAWIRFTAQTEAIGDWGGLWADGGELVLQRVRVGARVRAVWRPAEERTGAITDIRHFTLVE